jgi:predicted negative regulator of RcsB-dependent stress response
MQDALKPLHEAGDRSAEMAQSLADFGEFLAAAGRGSEAGKPVDEAQGLARELKNNSLQATILNTRGDMLFYGGDTKGAKAMYEQASRVASNGQPGDVLITKINLAKAALAEGHSATVTAEFGRLAQQAYALGQPQLAVECAVYQAQAMLDNKDFAHARPLLDQSLGKSEKLGLRLQTAKIHYLLGTSLRLSGNAADAAGQYGQALRQLDEIKKDPGADHVLDRSDLRTIYADATRWLSAPKS